MGPQNTFPPQGVKKGPHMLLKDHFISVKDDLLALF